MSARHHASQHVRHLAQLEIRLARSLSNLILNEMYNRLEVVTVCTASSLFR